MKKIIDGKLYNTATADEIAVWENFQNCSDFRYCSEALYKTKKGNYFLFCEGGPLSKYSESGGGSTWGITKITTLGIEEAKSWCITKEINVGIIEAEFGEFEEA